MSLALAACQEERARPTGGGSVQPGEKIAGLYVAGGDQSIARIDLDHRLVREINVGKEPTRIARVGSRVYVTLRAERGVAVLEENGAALETIGRINTDAEPYGIAANESRVYVAASTGGSVSEYDAKTFELLRSWKIAGEPRWVALHPTNKALYVGSVYGGIFTHINLDSGIARQVALPAVQSFNFLDGTPIELSQRIFDVAIAPDGEDVYVGAMYIDNKTAIQDVDPNEPADPNECDQVNGGMRAGASDAAVAPPPGGTPVPPNGCNPGGGYDNQKFNPAIDKMPVDSETGEMDASRQAEAINILSFATIEDQNGFPISGETINGYPAAIAVSDDSSLVLAAIEGSEAVVAIKVDFDQSANGGGGFAMGAPEADVPAREPGGMGGVPFGSFSFRQTVSVKTGAGPRGIAIVDGRAYVHSFFDRKVEEISLDEGDRKSVV